jgi:hypothetical protein
MKPEVECHGHETNAVSYPNRDEDSPELHFYFFIIHLNSIYHRSLSFTTCIFI